MKKIKFVYCLAPITPLASLVFVAYERNPRSISTSLDWDLYSADKEKDRTISLQVGAGPTGTHSSENTVSVVESESEVKFADFLDNNRYTSATISGYFDFHPYASRSELSSLVLWRDFLNSTTQKIVFKCEFQKHAKTGWAEQTSTMTFTINVTPNESGGLVFECLGRAYAGTSGSVHSVYTYFSVQKVSFSSDDTNTPNNQQPLLKNI